MNVGAIIIGDELLSGKREDKHLQQLIRMLAARGMKLDWAEYLGDDPARISRTLRRTLSEPDLVFSFGGIGATPDDHTRQCAAAAADLPLAVQEEGRTILEGRFGAETYPHRINLVTFPQGARLIPNPVNQIPGFSLSDHHFVPGFPSMAWPMIEWVLDTHYRHLHSDSPDIERGFIALRAREGDLIDLMQAFVARYPQLKLSSLPSFGTETLPPHIEFGVTGQAGLVGIALNEFRKGVSARGYELLERT